MLHTCAHFCYKMRHSWTYVWCIVGFVRHAYLNTVVSSVCNDVHWAAQTSQHAIYPCEWRSDHIWCQFETWLWFLLWSKDGYAYHKSLSKCLLSSPQHQENPKILEPGSHVHDHTCIYHEPDVLVLQYTQRIVSPIDAFLSINHFHSIPTKIGKSIIWIHP